MTNSIIVVAVFLIIAVVVILGDLFRTQAPRSRLITLVIAVPALSFVAAWAIVALPNLIA